MRAIRLVLAVTIFLPGFALLGAFACLDSGFSPWIGLAIGSIPGLFFGLVFGGAVDRQGKIAAFLFGPEQDD